jgi:iron-sulfur cluster assembly protein
MAIQMTPVAIERVHRYLEQEHGAALRVGVRRTGCSGWAYVVELARDISDEDHRFDVEGIQVVVDPESLPLIDGSTIDFVTEGLNRTFKFDNPNATEECGCGESFTVQ